MWLNTVFESCPVTHFNLLILQVDVGLLASNVLIILTVNNRMSQLVQKSDEGMK